ncbi:MAG: helix-turn-helix transcriptional regulator [Steroidobacteraceae bacterium]
MPNSAQHLRELRLKSGRSEGELAAALGLTPQGYTDLEHYDSDIDSAISIQQALELARLLGTDLAGLIEPNGKPIVPVRIGVVRAALVTQLERSPEAREVLEDAIDWDLGPFLEGLPQWTTVYTLEFLRRLATIVDIDWRRLLVGIEHP